MKVPELFFIVINPVMRLLLRSPFHSLMSKSLMLITFTGRKSKRLFTTPVRYVRVGDSVRCYTNSETLWWRNLQGGAEVTLRIEGEEKRYRAEAIHDEPAKIREALQHYLSVFPQDAAYHEIRLTRDRQPVPEDLDRASRNSVVVEAHPV